MIIYNITTKVDWSVYEEWMTWMKEEKVPAMLRTGLFNGHRIMRLLDTDESDGPTFAVQYFASSLENYNSYLSVYLAINSREESGRWGERLIQFSTVMEVVT